MPAHLRNEHGLQRFRLASHVHLGGPRKRSQHITWNPAKATFDCALCPDGVRYSTGEITDERVQSAQMFDEALRPHLAGLMLGDQRDAMTRLYRGRLNQERYSEAGEADLRAITAQSLTFV